MQHDQSYLFDKTWTIPRAIEWLQEHGKQHYKVDETDNYYRFRQFDPKPNTEHRLKNIGQGIKIILEY
jgi:hypothetical protein